MLYNLFFLAVNNSTIVEPTFYERLLDNIFTVAIVIFAACFIIASLVSCGQPSDSNRHVPW